MKGYARIHAIARCQDCKWEEENFILAPKKAREHHNKTGHKVDIEIGYWKQYGEKKNG